MSDNRKILIIGNGYDLAHGLKTKYVDFLTFVRGFSNEKPVKGSIGTEFDTIIKENRFIHYFLSHESVSDNWAGFETELRTITNIVVDYFLKVPTLRRSSRPNEFYRADIQPMEYDILSKLGVIHIESSTTYFIEPAFYQSEYGVNIEKVKDYLRIQLDQLRNALVIYLQYYMPNEFKDQIDTIDWIEKLTPDFVITFNYTDTYKRYGIDSDKVQHIHGSLDSGNIVLGFEDDEPDDLNLIFFKKYFQRIQFHLDSLNTDPFYTPDGYGGFIKSDSYVIGLSLDYTDSELIKEIYTISEHFIIYYRNQKEYETKVVNLIRILGKQVFLQDLNKKIRFEQIDT